MFNEQFDYNLFGIGVNGQLEDIPYCYIGKGILEATKNFVIIGAIKKNRSNGEIVAIENIPPIRGVLIPKESVQESQKLWRYIDFSKLESLIRKSKLYFARVDQFQDKLEGVPLKFHENVLKERYETTKQLNKGIGLFNERIELTRKSSFVTCFHINDEINFDMWNQYGGQNVDESIAIETTVYRLQHAHEAIISEVISYYNEGDYNQEMYWFPTLFKQKKYSNEREFRVGIYARNSFSHKGIEIPVNLEQVICKIHLHPDAKQPFKNKVVDLLKKKHLERKVAS